VIEKINQSLIPVKFHIKEQPESFQRFSAQWTPTVLVVDADGKERHRMEGFYSADDYLAQLELGLGKLHFQNGNYKQAEDHFQRAFEDYPQSGAAAESAYWAGVARYKSTNDAAFLGDTAKLLSNRFPDSEWSRKASVWSQ
jgi:TolA-binding protein